MAQYAEIKFSVGQQGNDNIGAYAYTDLYDLVPTGSTSMGATFKRMGNPDITWETTTNYNLGVEFSLWEGRLSGNVDYYVKRLQICCLAVYPGVFRYTWLLRQRR